MNTMIKTRKMYHLAAAFVALAGLAGQAAYAGPPAVAQDIQTQGKQALNTIRGELAASIKTPARKALSLPKMTVYASPLDNAARQLRYTAVRQIRAELNASVAAEVTAVLRMHRYVTFAEATLRAARTASAISAAR